MSPLQTARIRSPFTRPEEVTQPRQSLSRGMNWKQGPNASLKLGKLLAFTEMWLREAERDRDPAISGFSTTSPQRLQGRAGGEGGVTPLCSGKGYICAHLFGG